MIRSIAPWMVVAALICTGGTALAVPQVFQYQGRLTDDSGEPLSDPTDVTFSLYAEGEGGEPLWSQTFAPLTLDNGRFNVLLGGEDAPFTPELLEALQAGADLFLGIQVGEDPELTPRQQIASVPYGLHAGVADSAGVAESAETAAFADTAEFAREAGHALTADVVNGTTGIVYQSIHRMVIPVGSPVSIVSVTLNAPIAGFVLVQAAGTLVLDNTAGQGALSHANIGEEFNAAPEATMGLAIGQVDSTNVHANFYVPIHCQRVYEVEAGDYTYHLNVNNLVVGSQVSANRPSITAIFIPVVMGTAEIEGSRASPAPRGR